MAFLALELRLKERRHRVGAYAFCAVSLPGVAAARRTRTLGISPLSVLPTFLTPQRVRCCPGRALWWIAFPLQGDTGAIGSESRVTSGRSRLLLLGALASPCTQVVCLDCVDSPGD